jgi:hypothetical protein
MARTKDDKASDLSIATAKLTILAIIGAAAVCCMSRVVDHFRPRIGDIISFYPSKVTSAETATRIEVVPAGLPSAKPCLLDVHTMRISGGSLIIEAVGTGSKFVYRAHWAGGPTSDGQTSCGASAELLLSHEEFSALKMATTP